MLYNNHIVEWEITINSHVI